MTMVSKYVSLKEVSKSNTASKLGIDNTPTGQQLANIKLLCEKVVDPIREWKKEPIFISSCFRSDALNAATKGSSKTSQHTAKNGAAIDLDDTGAKVSNNEVFDFIRKNLDFDQLIAEYPVNGKLSWVHVSYKATGNRKQILIAISENGKPKYLPYVGNAKLIY